MKYINLGRGLEVKVDNKDYDKMNMYKWSVQRSSTTNYAQRHLPSFISPNRDMVWMHREILGISSNKELYVDHLNGNGLDNRRANLRICTRAEMNLRSRKRRIAKSSYKGVHLKDGKWAARITYRGKRKWLGCYTSERQAAQVYDVEAKKIYGKFARLNLTEAK